MGNKSRQPKSTYEEQDENENCDKDEQFNGQHKIELEEAKSSSVLNNEKSFLDHEEPKTKGKSPPSHAENNSPQDKRKTSLSEFWHTQKPIFVAIGKKNSPIQRKMFPRRIRSKFCYLCGDQNDLLIKCAAANCQTRFHSECARKSILGGYTYSFMKRNGKEFCSLHHCTACFADHNRTRCFNGELIQCDQCELAWHVDCIPAGCEIDEKRQITCPRHAVFQDSPNLHIRHCADCQQEPQQGEALVKCTKCFRALHFNCYNKKMIPLEDTEEERKTATCNWCDMFDFARYGEYAMGRLSNNKWYPCQIVKNEEFPKKDPHIGSVGYVCVKWLPYRGKTYYNLITYNRIIAMAIQDYFYVTEAKKSDIYTEWKLAQQFTLQNSPLYRPLKNDQIPDKLLSNGERMIRKINHNKYSKPELKTPRDRLFKPDLCKCVSGAKDRCGPSSQCINRLLRLECPKECNNSPNKKCKNRRISEGNNCIQVKIEYFPGKGYGAIALEEIAAGGFVGEYVGEVIENAEQEKRINRIAALQSNEAQYYMMELDEKRAIDAQYYGNDMRYVNHSCTPNCVIQQYQSDSDIHLVLIANRNIKKGEELSFDYNMQGKGRGMGVPVCRCKSENCTGILSADSATKRSMYNWEEKPLPCKSKSDLRLSTSFPALDTTNKRKNSLATSALRPRMMMQLLEQRRFP